MFRPVCILVEIGSQRKFELVVDSKRLVVVEYAGCQHQNCSSRQAAESSLQADSLQLDLQKLKK